ncbi:MULTISPECIES: regulatory protein RecX [Oceanibaculum]|uniref:Regulatory protein RecX n=2 Tax=Oceanibaculum indicum TaxID=526216 RepID=K2J673_9PROT|nr:MULTISPECIES: regulatory protein RecX [Oceanibaculum]EKE70548.1 putative regulator of DNA repair (RecX-like) protein [Oceanibaculum indicum P24]MCH2394726.1 RecX family transcriptional regulator [Oceanibaculum sp.]RKQ73814.1 regulatory protein [Oceanibaculum indicum]
MTDSAPKPNRPARKIPRKPSPASLERAALHYLERFASSAENLRRVLLRKVERAARHHEDIDREAAAGWIDDLIARYRRAGLLDDKAYAEARTTSLHRRGASARKIRLSLAQKGVAADTVDAALEELDERVEGDAEMQAAIALVRRRRLGVYRAASVRADYRDRDLAALARAGFSYDIARRVIEAEDEGALMALAEAE